MGEDTVFVAFRANRNNLCDMWVTRSTDNAGTFEEACLFYPHLMISPAFGAVLMSVSTIVVALNAQLLRRILN